LEQSIIETANKYNKLAKMLNDLEAEVMIDEDLPEDVQSALVRLYYAKAFESEIEKCEDLLGEDTDEETVGAVMEAAEAAESASESAFGDIEAYSIEDRGFAKMIEGLSASSETDGLKGLLFKLYKCEGIIRVAERCSMRFPLYGMRGLCHMPQEDEVMDQQQSIEQQVGIDIVALLELRQRLVEQIGGLIRKDGRFA
jgi:hypothetical protein